MYTNARRPKTIDGVIRLDVPLHGPGSTVDLALYLNRDGYRPAHVLGLPVAPGGRSPT